jgi:arsenate reductase
MKKIYFLKTCSTCQRILKSLNLSSDFQIQDIKETPLTAEDLEKLKSIAGSYEDLFSRRAKLYKEMGLKNEKLSERDYRNYILEHYTFLKRPVIVYGQEIFIGNSSKTIESVKIAIRNEK